MSNFSSFIYRAAKTNPPKPIAIAPNPVTIFPAAPVAEAVGAGPAPTIVCSPATSPVVGAAIATVVMVDEPDE